MKLRDRPFERRFKRRVRQEINASPVLRREAKRVRPPTSLKIPPLVARLVMTGFLVWAASVLGLTGATERVLSAFAIVVALMEAVWLAGKLPSVLYDPAQLAVLTPLPIADHAIFRRQWREYVLSGLGTTADLAAIHLVIGIRADLPPALVALGCVLGALQGAGAFSLGTLLGVYRWHPLYQSAGCLGITLVLGVAFWGVLLAPWLIPVLDFAAPVLFCVPPVGWFEAAWHFGVRQGSGVALALLLPAIVLSALVRFGHRRAKANYSLAESVREAALAEETPQETSEANRPSPAEAQHWPEATPEQIKLGLAEQPDWSGLGRIERFVQQRLTPRERRVAWLLKCEAPNWSKRWQRSVTFTLLAIAGAQLPEPLGRWGFWIPAVLATLHGLPVFGGNWPGFAAAPNYGALVPSLAFFPVGFREISRVVLKANVVLCATFLPQALLLGSAGGWLHRASLVPGLFLGLKTLLAIVSVQPMAAFLKLSQATNDTSHITWRSLRRALALVFLVLQFVGLAIALLLVTEPLPALGLVAAMFATSLAAWAYYARTYDRCRFDLVRANQQ